MTTKEQADNEAANRVYGRMLAVSPETSAALAKLPGTTLDEKLFMLTERSNELEQVLEQIVRAFDAPHRVSLTQAVVRARELLKAS